MTAIFALIALLQLPNGNPNEMVVRQQEAALVHATRTGDQDGLLQLTYDGLTITLYCRSGSKFSRIDIRRTTWINDVTKLQVARYEVSPSEIRFAKHDGRLTGSLSPYDELAMVRAAERINLITQNGTIQKDLSFVDTWARLKGSWKLVNRMYSPRGCENWPRLIFP